MGRRARTAASVVKEKDLEGRGVKARAAYVEHKTAKVAQAAGYVEHLPPRAVTSVWGDLPLYVAVVAGTILRRWPQCDEVLENIIFRTRCPILQ